MKMLPFLLLLASAPGGEITLVTSDNRHIVARDPAILEIAGHLTIEYSDAASRRQAIRCADVVEMAFGRVHPRTKFAPEDVVVTTTTGDIFFGALSGPGKEKYTVRLGTGPFGEIELHFEQLSEMRFLHNRAEWPKREVESPRVRDLLVTKTSDRAEGSINVVDKTAVEYKSRRTNQLQKVAVDQLTLILFQKPSRPAPKPPDTLYAILTASDGSSVQGKIAELKEGILRFHDLRGVERKLSAASLAGLHFRNGRVVYLSDLPPSKVEENAYYIRPPDGSSVPSDKPYPWKADRNADGAKLSIRSREFQKGIGVRAYSSLTWSLGEKYRKFQASVGLDDCAQRGEVVFEVWVDGKKRASHNAKVGESAFDIEVGVAGAKELRLVADFGGLTIIGEFADWGLARLLKE